MTQCVAMEQLGWLIHVLGALLAAWFWLRMRGQSLERIIEHSEHEHHRVREIFVQHPGGGTWGEFRTWLRVAHRD